MRKIIFIISLAFILASCSKEYKAEHAVTNFIKQFSTNPESYEPVGFSAFEKDDKGFKITHGYRIIDKNGKKRVIYHTFKLSDEFNIEMEAFEEID